MYNIQYTCTYITCYVYVRTRIYTYMYGCMYVYINTHILYIHTYIQRRDKSFIRNSPYAPGDSCIVALQIPSGVRGVILSFYNNIISKRGRNYSVPFFTGKFITPAHGHACTDGQKLYDRRSIQIYMLEPSEKS